MFFNCLIFCWLRSMFQTLGIVLLVVTIAFCLLCCVLSVVLVNVQPPAEWQMVLLWLKWHHTWSWGQCNSWMMYGVGHTGWCRPGVILMLIIGQTHGGSVPERVEYCKMRFLKEAMCLDCAPVLYLTDQTHMEFNHSSWALAVAKGPLASELIRPWTAR
jgi:hypothetical protein